MKIISGGQTGVDRAALDAAISHGIDCGGWCPEGRTAEDGTISLHYPVIELPGSGYSERTLRNVSDSDGTLIIYFDYPTGGTEQTLLFCIEAHKPYLLIDANELSPKRAALKTEDFVHKFAIQTLNVAGPRASGNPDAYNYALKVVSIFIQTGKQI
jgi:hypothetical protein